jgi:hypothetical protein
MTPAPFISLAYFIPLSVHILEILAVGATHIRVSWTGLVAGSNSIPETLVAL